MWYGNVQGPEMKGWKERASSGRGDCTSQVLQAPSALDGDVMNFDKLQNSMSEDSPASLHCSFQIRTRERGKVEARFKDSLPPKVRQRPGYCMLITGEVILLVPFGDNVCCGGYNFVEDTNFDANGYCVSRSQCVDAPPRYNCSCSRAVEPSDSPVVESQLHDGGVLFLRIWETYYFRMPEIEGSRIDPLVEVRI